MDVLAERDRLMRVAAERMDTARHALPYVLPYAACLCALGLAVFLPRHDQLFGATPPAQVLMLAGGCAVFALLSALTHRRFGHESRAFAVAECFEVLFITGTGPMLALTSGLSSSPFLLLIYPIGPVFWAQIKPNLWSRYAWVTLGPPLLVTILCFDEAREASLLWLAVGLAANGAAFLVASSRKRNFLVEAERNFEEEQLADLRSAARRRALARSVERSLGDDLRHLADELDRRACTEPDAEFARTIARTLELATSAEPPCSTHALAERIETKCAPLCTAAVYDQQVHVHDQRSHDAITTTALLRIAQELVRNAVTHAAPSRVSVELRVRPDGVSLSVRDDGRGLSNETFERSRGGLDNARRRLRELGGDLTRGAPSRGTELIASIPFGRSDLAP